jgi:prephenate dehydrogenase
VLSKSPPKALSSTTYCYDLSPRHLDLLPKTIRACPTDGLGIAEYKDNFRTGDWVVLAVPQPALQATVSELVPLLPPGILVIVSTSTQRESLRLLREHVPSNCEYLGFHPLFSPTVGSPIGQIAALIDLDVTKQQHQEFMKTVGSTGLLVTPLSVDDHDRYMALVQSLTHFCLIGFAATVGDSGIPPSTLLKLKTPNFQFLYAFASRVLKLTTTTTGSIQFTPEAKAIRESFLSMAQTLHNKLSSSSTVSECALVIDEARAPLSSAEVDEGAEISAVAVDALQRFEELLHTYKVSERPFVFLHRITGLVHIVRIIDITYDEVHFLESTKQFMNNEGEHPELIAVAIGLLDQARDNYRRAGIRNSVRINYSNSGAGFCKF